MHYFTHLTRFNNQGCLYPFLYGDQMVMNRTDGKEGRDRCQLFIDIFITQDDVIHSVGNGLFRFFAQFVKGRLQTFTSFGCFKQHREFDGVETFVPDIA